MDFGKGTNNEAELMSLISGLLTARALKPDHIDCYTDSLLTKNLLNGWKTKAPTLKVLVRLGKAFLQDSTITIHHLPRKEIRKVVGH